ncbi:MAG: hypothetical protein SGI99_09840 [Pseudomonadota bacterium]|nr:hypothetical protein [Pseudomonadota bacterium]
MNRLIVVFVLLLLSPLAMAGTPRVDARQERQDDRIDQGVASGELTHREENRLEAQQEHIDDKEARAKSDGVVTARERASLHRSENRASRNIRRQKHDRQDHD